MSDLEDLLPAERLAQVDTHLYNCVTAAAQSEGVHCTAYKFKTPDVAERMRRLFNRRWWVIGKPEGYYLTCITIKDTTYLIVSEFELDWQAALKVVKEDHVRTD